MPINSFSVFSLVEIARHPIGTAVALPADGKTDVMCGSTANPRSTFSTVEATPLRRTAVVSREVQQ
jgi:hypothetical protein